MTEWLIVEDNIITNVIVADEAFAESIGAKPHYAGARIGSLYDPPTLEKQVAQLQSQIEALSMSNQFLEDCLVEMVGIVYA